MTTGLCVDGDVKSYSLTHSACNDIDTHLTAIFPRQSGLASARMSPLLDFIGAKGDRAGMVWYTRV